MAEYTLYSFAQSGHSYKAALMLSLCSLEWEPRVIDFFNKESHTDTYRTQINEMGEVPVLLHGSRKYTQSGVILDYLAEQSGRFGWGDGDERREILRWIFFDNHKFTGYLSAHRFLWYVMKTDNDATAFTKMRAEAALAIVEKHLAGRTWVVLDRPTIADISMAGYVFYDGEFDLDFENYPALCAWRDRLRALPGWAGPYDLLPEAPPAKG